MNLTSRNFSDEVSNNYQCVVVIVTVVPTIIIIIITSYTI
jgi:hypothetical protein